MSDKNSATPSRKGFSVPVNKFSILISQVKIENQKMSIIKSHVLELTEATANVNDISQQISKNFNVPEPIILNCNLEKIENEPANRGELFWNRRFKYFFTSRVDWESLGEKKRPKSVSYPVQEPLTLKRTKSDYWPVTLPRTFRRSFTRMKLLGNNLLVYKHLPFDLNEFIANVDSIKKIMREEYGLVDPVILDQRRVEVRDSPRTRGELFWNTNQNFYFIERATWAEYERKRTEACINSPRIEHVTFFDPKRATFYKARRVRSNN